MELNEKDDIQSHELMSIKEPIENNFYTGIQVNLTQFDSLAKKLQSQLLHLTNNLGDCFEPQSCPLPNTMIEEQSVIKKIAEIQDLNPEQCWGYIGEGSSSGNLQGMWIARTLYPNATLVFPKSAHYSIYKYAQILDFKKIKIIDTLDRDILDLVCFNKKIDKNETIILILTLGTTMTASYDPVIECINILKNKNCDFYLHIDAALGGMVIPFINKDKKIKHQGYTFENQDIKSMTISMHKMLGSPMPANVFLTRTNIIDRFKNKVNDISYLGDIKDLTLYGSRDGFRAMAIYLRINELDYSKFKITIYNCLNNAEYIVQQLRMNRLLEVFRNPFGMAVVIPINYFIQYFSKKNQLFLIKKYHLVKNEKYIHMYVMPHVNLELCNNFVRDCIELSE